ncbi:hypothetical protein V496_05290 [Pseudogymnoascus sp. VKM F-4515 (FW-2607)]|nr:hypothetical protein V496_05290 [Pseudogymnoascus sp. VKM F-4515 (FW-2607)]
MPPCARCEKRGLDCIVSSRSTRCGECVRVNAPGCNTTGPSLADWEKLKREEDRLDREQELAELSILQAHQAAIESLARSQRLKKQRALLRERGSEMLRRGLATLDELEEAEERNRREAEARSTLPTPSNTNSEVVDPEHDPYWGLSPGFFDRLGADGGTPPATLGS